MDWIVNNVDVLGAALVVLHLVATVIVNLTDTPLDDKILGKVYRLVEKLAGVVNERRVKQFPGEGDPTKE